MILSPLLLFLLACHNNPVETKVVSNSNTATKDYAADSTKKWTRNIDTTQRMVIEDNRDTINYTDANNLKQGKWCTVDARGRVLKTEFYKDGKLVKGS